MRHKLKKAELNVIVQKMANDTTGDYLADLLRIYEVVQKEKQDWESIECQNVLKYIKWLYGYENEIQKTLQAIKCCLEEKVFNKDLARVTIMSSLVCYCVLQCILDAEFDLTKWYIDSKRFDNKKLIDSIEVLQRYCHEWIDVDGFYEARRYIKMWDFTLDW